MAEPKKKSEEPSNQHPPIAEFNERYEVLLGEARIASQLTHEDAWGNLYREEMKGQRGDAKQIGEALQTIGKRVADGFEVEEDEKGIGEQRKALQELNVRRQNFARSTVAPIKHTVDDCENFIAEVLHRASYEKERAPLINKGTEALVRAAIKAVYRPEWNDKEGRITLLVHGNGA